MIVVLGALRTELLFVRRGPRLALGIGARAAERLSAWLRVMRPDRALVIGFCGGADPSLGPGDLVLADALLRDGERVDVPGGPLAEARRALPGAKVGPLLTVEGPADPAAKARASAEAVGVDMESYHIARVLSGHGIPFLVLRCVLDPLWEDPGRRWRYAIRALRCARSLGSAAGRLLAVLEGAGDG